MGVKQVRFCDFCLKEFERPGQFREAFKLYLKGGRYTDGAGSMDINQYTYEGHKHCWERFFQGKVDAPSLESE